MKTKAKYVIVILFLCTIPLYFCRMIGWKDDAIRLYDVILYGMESQEGDSFVGGMIWKLMQERDRKSTRLNSSHTRPSRMPSSA